MRNILKKTAFLIFALASLFVMSCTDIASEHEIKSGETGTLIFSGTDLARSINPTVNADLTDFKKITLLGAYNGGAETVLGTWETMAAFKEAQVAGVKIGSWVLTLRAETLATGGAVYSDTQTVTVQGGTNAVSFSLTRTSLGTGNGTIAIDITLASTAATNVKAAEVLVDGTAVSATLASSKISYTDNTKVGGQYTVTVKFYGETDKKLFLNSITNVVNVGAGLITTWSETISDVDAIYQITYTLGTGETLTGSYQEYYTKASGVSSLPTPAKTTGDSKIWIFDGWYDNVGLTGTAITSIEVGSTGTKTLYPKFTEYTPPARTSWDFTNLSNTTKTNVGSDSDWVIDGSKHKKTGLSNAILTANGTPIEEAEGLIFTGSATLYWDDSKSYLQTGATIVIPVVPRSTLKIVYAQTGSNKGARTFSLTENGGEEQLGVGSPSTTTNAKDTVNFAIGDTTSSVTLKCYGKDSSDTGPMFNFDSIEVIPPVYVTGVAISGLEAVKVGKTINLTATVTPTDATNKTVMWVSSDTSVATVDSNGVVTGVSAGTAKIIAKSNWTADNSEVVSAEHSVAVADAIKPTSISISCDGATSLAELGKGYTKGLTVSYAPNGVEDQFKGVIWTSSNPSVVSVTGNGDSCSIKALAVGGPVTITATTTSTLVSPALTATFVITSIVDKGTIPISIKDSGGWLESAFAEWEPYDGATGYNAYVKATSASTWTKLDKELIRGYSNTAGGTTVNYYRVDALGLKAGTYKIKLVAVSGNDGIPGSDAETGNLTVAAHTREGFAFMNGHVPGAYKADGTLKDGALVVYVDNNNKDTVTVNLKTDTKVYSDCVGLQNIILGYKKGAETRPISIRLIGNITDPAVLTKGDIYLDNVSTGGMTLEGVGEDAVANGWGIVLKGCKDVEVRNIASMNVNSDEGDDFGLQQDDEYCWVHNCDMFYGDAGSDADQAKGDGALDTKKSHHITHTYNHFWDNGKCNLQGANESDTSNYITYHHNWYDHADSRLPRVRVATVHVYNNYYDGNAKYGIGATTGASVFAENNYFRSTVTLKPMMIAMQGTDPLTAENPSKGTFSSENGGIIKAYGNVIDATRVRFLPYGGTNSDSIYNGLDSTVDFDAYVATSRNEIVPSTVKAKKGGATYNNFDTDSSIMYSYTPDSAADAKTKVLRYAGRMRKGDISTASFFFDLSNYTPDIDKSHTATHPDGDYNVIRALKTMLTNYVGNLVTTNVEGGTSGGTDPNPPTPPTSDPTLTLNPTSLTLSAGGMGTINAILTNSTDAISWSSNSSAVSITSSSDGKTCTVTAGSSAGSATITATAGSLSKTCNVTVNAGGGGGNTGGGSDSTTWLPGDTRSWLTGVTGSKSTNNRSVFDGMMNSTGFVEVAVGATFTVTLPSACTKITVYMASNDSNDSELTAKIGSTTVGTYTMPNRGSNSTTPMIVTVAAGSKVDFKVTGQKKGALCKVVIEYPPPKAARLEGFTQKIKRRPLHGRRFSLIAKAIILTRS